MRKKDFDLLCKSVREMLAIQRGDMEPARVTCFVKDYERIRRANARDRACSMTAIFLRKPSILLLQMGDGTEYRVSFRALHARGLRRAMIAKATLSEDGATIEAPGWSRPAAEVASWGSKRRRTRSRAGVHKT